MIWIEHRQGEAIPECLYYDDWQTDKDDIGRTPLLIWFKWRPKEAIPQELYYPGWKNDKHKYEYKHEYEYGDEMSSSSS